jgi:CubicO group peptidase (beta-lactamase class C family)
MDNSFADNTYGGLYATAGDLARLGQMLLNRGEYGDHRFLSRKAFEALVPKPLWSGDVDRKKSWGIGCSPLGGDGLSDSTFGHEAASGAVLRIDPVNHLVVIVARDQTGPDYAQYKRFVTRFLRAVASPLEEHRSRE